ncbi:hypothetical protein F3Y22_tig00111708pilonHSYRG00531 [Hibiscus syriacus]|uniref:Protein kinase domain-containing protein n=1 Tax=Hibiscus syriacus TaxID=106335 RepID=A0A6A2XGT6_HIBSY|nr:hypothetical protein F3Y22_tig00111708pilonHSYRG00531 [Hibiscus syriacus]
MDWKTRYKIAIGTAKGLHYLHKVCQRRIIRRDIKSSNILLTADFKPQISDSEWRNGFLLNGHTIPLLQLKGQPEIISGRKPVDASHQSLHCWEKPLLNREEMDKLVDPRLGGSFDSSQLKLLTFTASLCIRPWSAWRPTMTEHDHICTLAAMCSYDHSRLYNFVDLVSSSIGKRKNADKLGGKKKSKRMLSKSDGGGIENVTNELTEEENPSEQPSAMEAFKFRFTGFMDYVLEEGKLRTGISLIGLPVTHISWVMGGDFNELLHPNEKLGVDNVREWIWTIFETSWKRSTIAMNTSDHSAIPIEMLGDHYAQHERRRGDYFKFDLCWAKEEIYRKVVEYTWQGTQGSASDKIEVIGQNLGSWKKDRRWKAKKEKERLCNLINNLEKSPITDDSVERLPTAKKKELKELIDKDETFWIQRSRVAWLKDENQDEIFDIATGYFSSLFTFSRSYTSLSILNAIERCITTEDNACLNRDFTTEEVLHAYSQISPNRAPGRPRILPWATLVVGKGKISTCSFVRNNIAKRMQGWTKNLLSFGGREVFMKSLAQALPTYVMSCYLLPDETIDDIISQVRSFGGQGLRKQDKRGWAMVSWDKIYRAKKIRWYGLQRHQVVQPRTFWKPSVESLAGREKEALKEGFFCIREEMEELPCIRTSLACRPTMTEVCNMKLKFGGSSQHCSKDVRFCLT